MSSNCPKCDSSDWKSAKLVILEGSTNSKATLNGQVTNNRVRKEGFKDNLLSDKWFTYDTPIMANLDSSTTSMLVDEVKELLVSEASMRQMPLPPAEPNPTMLSQKVELDKPKVKSIFATDPSQKKEPKAPEKPDNPVDKLNAFIPWSWFKNYRNSAFKSFVWIVVVIGLLAYFFPAQMSHHYKSLLLTFKFATSDTEGYAGISPYLKTYFDLSIPQLSDQIQALELGSQARGRLAVVATLILFWIARLILIFPSSFKLEKKRRDKYQKVAGIAEEKWQHLNEIYNEKHLKYRSSIDERNAEIARFNEEKSHFERKMKEFEAKVQTEQRRYDESLKQHEQIVATRQVKYLEEFANYEAEVAQVRSFRNELWDRARMCTRCGSMYMGPRRLQA